MVFFKELCISLTPSDFIGVSIISIIQLLAETRAYVCMSGHATDYILDLAYKLILSWTIKLNLSFRYPNCHSKVRTIKIVESTLKKLHHNICPAYFRKISLFSLLPHNQSPMQSCRSLQFPPKSILLVKGGHCVRVSISHAIPQKFRTYSICHKTVSMYVSLKCCIVYLLNVCLPLFLYCCHMEPCVLEIWVVVLCVS